MCVSMSTFLRLPSYRVLKSADLPVESYWLTGHFSNLEPEAEDTDYWALDHGYASITPIKLDMTAYEIMAELKSLKS